MLCRQGTRPQPPECFSIRGKYIAALHARHAVGLPNDEQRVSIIRDQDAAVMLPVTRDLSPVRGVRGRFMHRLDLENATEITGPRLDHTEVRTTDASVSEFGSNLHGRVKMPTDGIDQVFQSRTV